MIPPTDIISCFKLIHNAIQFLWKVGGAKGAYRSVCRELESLQSTLSLLDLCSLQRDHNDRFIAEIQGIYKECSDIIAEFLEKIERNKILQEDSSEYLAKGREILNQVDWSARGDQQVEKFEKALSRPVLRLQITLQMLTVKQNDELLSAKPRQDQPGEKRGQSTSAPKSSTKHPDPPPTHEEKKLQKDIDNFLKRLCIIGNPIKTSQGNSDNTEKEVADVILDASGMFRTLQEEAGKRKWPQLSETLGGLSMTLKEYSETQFSSFPNDNKRRVVKDILKTLENSLSYTAQTLASPDKEQRDSGPKGGHDSKNTRIPGRNEVGLCITNLRLLTSQIQGFMALFAPHGTDVERAPQEQEFNSEINTHPEAPDPSTSWDTSTFGSGYAGPCTSTEHIDDIEDGRRCSSRYDKSPNDVGILPKKVELCECNHPHRSECPLGGPECNTNPVDDQSPGELHLALGVRKVNANKSKMKAVTDKVCSLVALGADVNAPDHFGLCPIHYCALTINSEATKYLLKEGADINKCDEKGRTALNYAAADSHPDFDFVSMLIGRGGKLGSAKLPPMHRAMNQSQKRVRDLIVQVR
ncbi:hypothetical protein AOQ84DRAFT_380998 [Glonium stellatum]|uniref:Uncharacterized protein n=1 Tax=Glonium stellatum TaxID=574774 RepID=A0A8E2ESK2_9PEZI|nr:hypothetical protein AOQ84DRAFT_380998 [Glonium stellatum]